jgi:anaerobic selenocysteine-containing dehydrogenase
MSKKISRRDFLKLAGVGAATSAVLTGCGPASRYVVREPYTQMPEYTFNGQSTYFATTCRECAAGCGLVVRTYQGRAIKTEGNPAHPCQPGQDLRARTGHTARPVQPGPGDRSGQPVSARLA